MPGDALESAFPDDMAAIAAAKIEGAKFREEMAARAGGMLDRAEVADLLGVSPTTVEEQWHRREILGVFHEAEIRYPAAQFVDGETVGNLEHLLEALGDMDPWEQLMLLTTPVEGYGAEAETPFHILAGHPDGETLRQLVALFSSWAS